VKLLDALDLLFRCACLFHEKSPAGRSQMGLATLTF
jgi:hypothetical protein